MASDRPPESGHSSSSRADKEYGELGRMNALQRAAISADLGAGGPHLPMPARLLRRAAYRKAWRELTFIDIEQTAKTKRDPVALPQACGHPPSYS